MWHTISASKIYLNKSNCVLSWSNVSTTSGSCEARLQASPENLSRNWTRVLMEGWLRSRITFLDRNYCRMLQLCPCIPTSSMTRAVCDCLPRTLWSFPLSELNLGGHVPLHKRFIWHRLEAVGDCFGCYSLCWCEQSLNPRRHSLAQVWRETYCCRIICLGYDRFIVCSWR